MKTYLLIYCLSLAIVSNAQFFDVPPEPLGGNAEAKRILSEAFCAEKVKISERNRGKIDLKFIVFKDGSIDSLKFANGINREIDTEIARIFPLIQWLPGIMNDQKVSAWHLFSFRVNQSFYTNSQLCFEEINSKIFEYEDAEIQAQYVGSDFGKFVYSNLTYPGTALNNNLEGTVTVRFVVETNGRLSNLGTDNNVGGGCEQEAIRVVKSSRWKPAIKDAKAVRTQIYYPITFKLGPSQLKANDGGDMMRR
jgi:TonB family protein